ncbi:ABC transporter substrate-binding protein [Cohnella boryungensis]|uniref:ABC transporter substrate-binding protein n=1 Tax=Cohnella boryungensis TaxID=768479 RepID=A0ABV8S9P2_9BACL
MKGWKNKTIAAAAAILMLVALAACGSEKEKTDAPSASPTPTAAAATKSAEPSQETGKESEEETRIVKDEFGEVEVPVHPKRVVGVYVEDYLKALGVTPVAQWYHPLWGKQDYLNMDVPLFDMTGSIEALLAHDPDLIIVDGAADKEKYEQYSKIAPTVRLPENVLASSRDILRSVADALNIPEKADSVIAQYEQKIADAKAKLESAIGKETVAVIRLNVGEKTLALFGVRNRYTGMLYSEFGLEPPKMVKEMTEFQSILSEEAIPNLDFDHIIFLTSNGSWDSPENQEDIEGLNSPLWKTVPAFKKGNIYKVERSHWQSGAITANGMKLDDLTRLLVK